MKKSYLFFVSFLILMGCYTDHDNSTLIIHDEEDDTVVRTAITGHLLDDQDQIMTGYTLEINDQSFNVDNKYFLIDLEGVYKYGQHITVKKDGALIARQNTILLENSLNQIKLRTLPLLQSVEGKHLEDLMFAPSSKIALSVAKEGLKSADNQTLTTDYNINFRAISTPILVHQLGRRAYFEGQRQVLDIQDILEIDVTDPSNKTIDLGDASMINLKWINASPPTSLVFYKYNQRDARWRYFADYNNGDIILNQSGIYCLATAQEGVYIEGQLTKEFKAISYQDINLIATSGTYHSVSAKNGKYLALVGAENLYNIEFRDPCNTIIQSESFSVNQEDNSAIDFELNSTKFYNLGTSVFSCQEFLEPEVAVKITQDSNATIYIFNDEEVNSWISVCQDNFDIAAYDISSDQQGSSIAWETSYADNLSYLPICDDYPNGYSFIKIRDDYRLYDPFDFSFDGSRTNLDEVNGFMSLILNGNMQGSYATTDVQIKLDDLDFGPEGYFISCQNDVQGCGIENCVVTHYEPANGWIRVSFKGEIWMQTIDPPKAGNFPIEGVILCRT